MQKTKISLFFSFFLIVLLICPAFAADSYNNEIYGVVTYEITAGSYVNIGAATNDTYSEPFNISMSDEPIHFETSAKLNKTLANYTDIGSTIAMGLVITGDELSEAGPLQLVTPINPYLNDDFWIPTYTSTNYPVDSTETELVANFTLWIDYERNGTWTNTEYWILNLQYPEPEVYVPDTVNSMDFSFVWFWATVGSFFITSVSAGLAVKKISVGYFMIALFSGMFTYAFYQILVVGGG